MELKVSHKNDVEKLTLTKTVFIYPSVHINYKYPVGNVEEERKRWKTILQVNMNAKCRSLRSRQKLKNSDESMRCGEEQTSDVGKPRPSRDAVVDEDQVRQEVMGETEVEVDWG